MSDLLMQARNGVSYIYTYDDNGIRTSKSNDSNRTDYFLDGSLVLSEKTGNEIIYYTYDFDGSILSMNYQGNEYFYIKNIQGDIIEIVNELGNTVAKYRYDAWGNIIYEWDSGLGIASINPYRYRSYRLDLETGLYYLQSRYYNPTIGRFISADSINYLDPSSEQGLNLYAYTNNNPVMYTDGDGTSPKWYNPFSWGNGTKLIVGGAFIVAGLIATVATGGAFAPALLATAKAVGISMGISATIGGTVGGFTSLANGDGFWDGAFDGFIDGAVDGFMWGGIFAGTSQMLGSASKLLSSRQVDFSKNTNILFGNKNTQSTTLIRFNKAGNQLFRFDVDPTHLLHLHYGAGKAMRIHRWLYPLIGYNGIVNGLKAIFGEY